MRETRNHGVCARNGQRAQSKKFHHLPAGHVVVTLPRNGKILTPAGIFFLLTLQAVVLLPVLFVGHFQSPMSRLATSYSSVVVVPICSIDTSILCTLRGTRTLTLVRTVSPPNSHSRIATPWRVRSMVSRVVNVSAPEGHTVAHMGPLPMLVR